MAIDWSAPLQTRHEKPRKAQLLDGHGPGGRRRVAIIGDYALTHGMGESAYGGPPAREDWPTVFLFDENGRCNSSGADSPFDLVNIAETLSEAA